MAGRYYNESNPFNDTTWESPPSRRPESIRLDSHFGAGMAMGGGGIEYDNFSDSNSSDVFGNESYEYKVSNPEVTRGGAGGGGAAGTNGLSSNDGGIYIRSHGNEAGNGNDNGNIDNIDNNNRRNLRDSNKNDSGYTTRLKPGNNNHTVFHNNSNIVNDDIGTTVQHNGRTVRYVNVNDLINKIGFGRFHYQLIFLCGLGYIADSMWGNGISLIIAPVQNEFQISNSYIGYLASTLYFGMCMGSFFWGRLSDVVGRKFPFTLTLTFGGIFGLIGTFIGSFGWLLVVMFCLGFGIGGNIPVDGAILAEFLPLSHRGRTMVSLSVFWALGEFVACLIAWLIVPENICSTNESGQINMDCEPSDNMGWRYLIGVLGLLNCAFLCFRLGTNESPNFLITQGEGGRRRALNVLKSIAEINKCPPNTVTDDMILTCDNPMVNRSLVERLQKQQKISQNLNEQRQRQMQRQKQTQARNNNTSKMHMSVNDMYHERINMDEDSYEYDDSNNYHNNGNSSNNMNGKHNGNVIHSGVGNTGMIGNVKVDIDLTLDLETNSMSVTEIIAELFNKNNKSRNLRLATPLIWLAWFGGSFGVTIFGTFLPKLLSAKNIHLSNIYGDALIFSIASLPGPFVGAYLVENKTLGRRYTMTLSGIILSLLMFMFIFAEKETPIVIISCLIEFFCQIYFAGLMCYTPEAYPTDIRTTAAGIATGIRHVANILAPIIGGKTFGDTGTIPVALATVSMLIGGIGSAFLPFDTSTKRLVPTLSL